MFENGTFDLDVPLLMGILNVTPDSFSDGGLHGEPAAAADHAERMIADGAGVIDIGGESTRPGSRPPDLATELARVIPVVSAIRARTGAPLSVDTRRAAVARAALVEGADIINEVSALGDPAMAEVVARAGAGVVLMHMRGTPATMQDAPRYDDVAGEVAAELRGRMGVAVAAGIGIERIVVDPGIGFAKTFGHNLELIARLEAIAGLGRPVLFGASRKAFLGAVIGGAPPAGRDVATAAACVVALLKGAKIFRVHDVKMVREALRVAGAIRDAAPPAS